MEELEIIENETEQVQPDGHYEVVREVFTEQPIYDEDGNQTGTNRVVTGREVKWVWDNAQKQAEEDAQAQIATLKAELAKVKEDIEQVEFGLVRDDYEANKLRACELINAIRVLEGKEAREIAQK